MDFDDRLHSAFDALADSLQQEIAARLDAARADLAGLVRAVRDAAVAEAATEARRAAEQEVEPKVLDAVARSEQDLRAELMGAYSAASGRLLEAIRAIDSAQGLSEILDVLAVAAGAEVARAAIFLPQGATLKSWRLVGFEAEDDAGSSIELQFDDGGMIAEAGETGRPVRLDPGAARATLVPSFVVLPQQSRAVAIPLVMSSQVFAILYVDEGNREPASRDGWPATVEILARHAARAIEAVTVSRFAQVAEGAFSNR
jgi:hypothetical protein